MEVNPDIAKKYNIQITGLSVQLPVLILLKNGKFEDELRYPMADSKGKSLNVKYYSESKIVKLFDLEKLYLRLSSRTSKS